MNIEKSAIVNIQNSGIENEEESHSQIFQGNSGFPKFKVPKLAQKCVFSCFNQNVYVLFEIMQINILQNSMKIASSKKFGFSNCGP